MPRVDGYLVFVLIVFRIVSSELPAAQRIHALVVDDKRQLGLRNLA
ncbi:MAG TPA: hypothetical protein VGH11_02885 [Jatrophihabitans sp.]|jgi:hypothetical protein